ncbi:hypothetical protein SDC9_186711 [bioreactor metagenome]|uniref:Uncharacterized protein n=1 Tax=bioreactor metagenome TaxID=1076179 RepID=A0A645HUY7_9ZZZZ
MQAVNSTVLIREQNRFLRVQAKRGMHFPVAHKVFPRGVDHQILPRRQFLFGQLPLFMILDIVGQIVLAEVDRAVPCVVQFNPVSRLCVRGSEHGSVCQHHLRKKEFLDIPDYIRVLKIRLALRRVREPRCRFPQNLPLLPGKTVTHIGLNGIGNGHARGAFAVECGKEQLCLALREPE